MNEKNKKITIIGIIFGVAIIALILVNIFVFQNNNQTAKDDESEAEKTAADYYEEALKIDRECGTVCIDEILENAYRAYELEETFLTANLICYYEKQFGDSEKTEYYCGQAEYLNNLPADEEGGRG